MSNSKPHRIGTVMYDKRLAFKILSHNHFEYDIIVTWLKRVDEDDRLQVGTITQVDIDVVNDLYSVLLNYNSLWWEINEI